MAEEEESKRLQIKNHTLNLQIREESQNRPEETKQGLPEFLRIEYDGQRFLVRSFTWHNSQNIPYEHFYLEGPENRGRCIRFEFRPYPIDSESKNNPYMDKDIFLYSFLPPNEKHVTVTAFNMTQDIWNRMNIVCSATNFSFCLRNSEHLVNYIVFSKWNSNQMQMENPLREFFDDTLDGEDRKLIAMLPKKLKIIEEKKLNASQGLLFEELEGAAIRFDEKLSVAEFKKIKENEGVRKRAFNIIFAGPTGAGKSTLINLALNETVCKTAVDTSSSVTREVTILSGKYKCKDENDIRVNIFDTMGVCDTYLDNDEVIDDMMEAIDIKKSKVVIVCSGVFKTDQKDAISDFLQRLNYENGNNKDNFIFLYNKTEGMPQEEKLDGLENMGDALGVNLNHEITFSVPDANGKRIGMKYYAGSHTGFNTENYDQDCIDTFEVLTSRVLPQASDDHRKATID